MSYSIKCPGCGELMYLNTADDLNSIDVNCHGKGKVIIPRFFQVEQNCQNPLCEWSKVLPRVQKHSYY